ncbi:MAG TPA: TonB-dependent receptor, partial [Myxococcaceae bacterium]|nr:TonB-dependent receptor [Myxococcaceae bacterium]
EGVQLKLGADVDHRIANASTVLETPHCAGNCDLTASNTGGTATFSGIYAQLIWDRWPGWRLIAGIRVDDYHLVPGMDFGAVEPRLTVRRTLSDRWTLKGAAGLFHQPPTALIDLPVIDVSGLHYGLQQAIQLDTGVEWKPHPAIEVSADAYLNPLSRTVEIDPFRSNAEGLRGVNGVFSVAAAAPATHGIAYGLEVLIRHPIGGSWFGWLSLTLERSTRYTGFVRFDGAGNPIGVGFANLPFTFDQTFVLNGVLSYRLPRNWTLGAAVHFNTGRPESGDLTSSTEVPSLSGTAWIHVSQDQVTRLPPFFRIDARVQKSWVFDSFVLDLYLDALNATASSEVVSYDYQIDRFTGALVKKTNSVPLVIPTLGLRGTY